MYNYHIGTSQALTNIYSLTTTSSILTQTQMTITSRIPLKTHDPSIYKHKLLEQITLLPRWPQPAS